MKLLFTNKIRRRLLPSFGLLLILSLIFTLIPRQDSYSGSTYSLSSLFHGDFISTYSRPEIRPTIFLKYINSLPQDAPLSVPFHWSYLADLRNLRPLILNALPTTSQNSWQKFYYSYLSREYRDIYKKFPDFTKITSFPLSIAVQHAHTLIKSVIGNMFLYNTLPPRQLIFLSNDKDIIIPVSEKSKKNDSFDIYFATQFNEFTSAHTNDILSMNTQLLSSIIDKNHISQSELTKNLHYESRNSQSNTLSKKDFLYNLDQIKDSLQQKNSITSAEQGYLELINYYKPKIETSGKHFHEISRLIEDKFKTGQHYDWRFFNGLLTFDQRGAAIHHLFKAWLKFTNNEHVTTWIAHGTLLGWYWNGFTMLWDKDGDVQMPITHLEYMAVNFNDSIIFEDPQDGNGKYYFEVNPMFIQRTFGNGKNFIDARFIDIDTGLYIDITGLTLTNSNDANAEAVTYNCKNNHYYQFRSISPLYKTSFEGTIAYVPRDFEGHLNSEYKKDPLTTVDFQQYHYNSDLRIWVNDKMLSRCFSKLSGKIFNKISPNKKNWDLGELINTEEYTNQYTQQLAGIKKCTDVLEEFKLSENYTENHYQFMSAWKQNPDDRDILDQIALRGIGKMRANAFEFTS